MSYVKFNQVFAFLLVLSTVSAFIIPPRYTSKALPQLQAMFAPVSIPARKAGLWFQGRVNPQESPDKRRAEDVKAENQLLRDRLLYLEGQLELERQRNAQWARLGSLKDRCVPVDVVGSDSGTRDSLALEGSTLQQVRDRNVALYPGGIAGQIQGRAGIAGAQLRLVTDKGFKVRGRFVRIERDARGQPVPRNLTQAPRAFEGIGGALVIRPPLKATDVQDAGLRAGDVAVADEGDWHSDLRGLVLGVITKIEPKRDSGGFIEVRIEPQTNLEMLDEVMVLVK